ncbi:MAG: hypothetical protein Q9209_005719 [Squamulea sp. 1 TL-2023]
MSGILNIEFFSKALEDLDGLADVRAKLGANYLDKFDSSVNREIHAMDMGSSSTLMGTSDQLLQHLQRLIAVRTKLSAQNSRWDQERLSGMVNKFLKSARLKASANTTLKEEVISNVHLG